MKSVLGFIRAVFEGSAVKKGKNKKRDNSYAGEGICLGMCFGMLIGTMSSDSVGISIGISLGALMGFAVGRCILKKPEEK